MVLGVWGGDDVVGVLFEYTVGLDSGLVILWLMA
jgi:hypothetical protein